MHLVQRDCAVCPPHIPDHCDPSCNASEQCSVVFQTCDTCSTAVCIPTGGDSSSQSNGGSNVGAIVGGVVAAVVLVLIAIGFRWYRGRRAMAVAAARKRATFEPKPDVVASADTVLNRPDPNINIIIEKPESVMYSPKSQHTFEDGSPIRFQPPENPFSDQASIATASDRETNVIRIGLITPSSASLASRATGLSTNAASANGPGSIASSAPSGFTLHPPSESPRTFTFSQTQQQQQSNTPMRPQRGPDIDMRLDLGRPLSTASQGGALLPPSAPYAASSRTGMTGVSSRSSILSTSSSFLNEAPQIVTPQQANFRQVLGVQRAAVVQLGSSLSPTASLKSKGSSSTVGKSGSNPFNDGENLEKEGDVGMYDDRPMSSMSNAESIANISSAQRVQLIRPLNLTTPGSRPGDGRALLSPSPLSSSSTTYSPTIVGRSGSNSNGSSPSATPRAVDFRTAGQLTPPSQTIPRSFDDMMEQGPPSFDDMGRPSSLQSFAMTNRTSTADSILESFPFVPPSPISMHHTQPHQSQMQLQQQQHLQAHYQGRMMNGRGPSSLRTDSTQGYAGFTGGNNKPGRQTLGFSTFSSTSSGLGAFPFQFEGGGDAAQRNHSSTIGPSRLRHPQEEDEDEYYGEGGAALPESTIDHAGDRASLDTLQLSRDLSQFPLPMGTPDLGLRR